MQSPFHSLVYICILSTLRRVRPIVPCPHELRSAFISVNLRQHLPAEFTRRVEDPPGWGGRFRAAAVQRARGNFRELPSPKTSFSSTNPRISPPQLSPRFFQTHQARSARRSRESKIQIQTPRTIVPILPVPARRGASCPSLSRIAVVFVMPPALSRVEPSWCTPACRPPFYIHQSALCISLAASASLRLCARNKNGHIPVCPKIALRRANSSSFP